MSCCDALSSSCVVSRAFSALCVYSTFRHHPHPLGYTIVQNFISFTAFIAELPPWRKIAYSPSLFDARGRIFRREAMVPAEALVPAGNQSFRLGIFFSGQLAHVTGWHINSERKPAKHLFSHGWIQAIIQGPDRICTYTDCIPISTHQASNNDIRLYYTHLQHIASQHAL